MTKDTRSPQNQISWRFALVGVVGAMIVGLLPLWA
jgi:hypothetical protein